MTITRRRLLPALLLSLTLSLPVRATVLYVDVNSPGAVPPYADWNSAATNIQDAIDAAVAGDTVLVTNGVYATGGKVMGGDLTNRVAVTKTLTVQSVNGPEFTIIQGVWNPTVTNGPSAIRCAWLTNDAALSGFTLRGGATRAIAAVVTQQMNGGGVWGSSTTAVVTNCHIVSNTAGNQGGGAYQANLRNCSLTRNRAVGSGRAGSGIASAGAGGAAANCSLNNCTISENAADQGNGGGVINCALVGCAVVGNSSYLNGAGTYGGSLLNCTVVRNTSGGYSAGTSAVAGGTLTNCIVLGNFARQASVSTTNYGGSTLTFCNAAPLPAGLGNTNVDPQFLSDGIHLAETSPCRAIGTGITPGTDLDGQPWVNPPAMGCDEWQPGPVLATEPSFQARPGERTLHWNVVAAGQSPFTYAWFKDGSAVQDGSHFAAAGTANLNVIEFGPEHTGNYQVVVSNATGIVTSRVAQVVVHCVDAAGFNSVQPYAFWQTAATNIQDAVDVALPGEIVLVTNGIYAAGGKVLAGDLTNRVALDKALIVISVNGYAQTIIEGIRDPATVNGPAAVRCVWLADGAMLSGFTLRNGATRSVGDSATLRSGGGFWGTSSNAVVANCWLTNNAAQQGGGAAFGTVRNSVLVGNTAAEGGGAYQANLNNCTVVNNFCTTSPTSGGGTYQGKTRNCIVTGNYYLLFGFPNAIANYTTGSDYSYCCTTPSISGAGNLNASPDFLDTAYHLPAVSLCRGAGSAAYAAGVDNDGESWASPPSIGADEVVDANLSGPLSLEIIVNTSPALRLPRRNQVLTAVVTGRAARLDWDFGDGGATTNAGYLVRHTWTNAGDYTLTATAYNNDFPAGVSTNLVVHILPINQPTLGSAIVSNNAFRFTFDGQSAAKYTIQYATNLAPPALWQNLYVIFSSPGGPTQFGDAAWTNSARFYRVLAE